MTPIIDFVIRNGPPVLFGWVLLDQAGVPLPAVPLLLVVGALAGAGRLSLWLAMGAAVAGCLVADLLWYIFGRRRGAAMLGLMCRITLEPDSCVRRVEDMFAAYQLRFLPIAKFLPGLNPLAAALSGVVKIPLGLFVLCEAASALAWSATWIGLGYLFSDLIEPIATQASRLGGRSVVVLLGLPRRLCGSEVRPAAALLPGLAHGPDQSGSAEAADGRREAAHGGRPALGRGGPGAAVHDPGCPSHQPRGAREAPGRDPARRGDRPLLHVTQRSDQRPGGAHAEEARDHARASSRRRARGLARARLPHHAPGRSGPAFRLSSVPRGARHSRA